MAQPASDITLASWRSGEDADLLAPFCGPGDLFGDERVLLVAPRDGDALALASSVGAELILRTTPRQRRTRSLTSEPPGASLLVATSLDALGSPILRRELHSALGGVPWCLWWPEAVLESQAGHGGRGAWIDRLREGFSGGMLRRWSDGSLAPEGCTERAGTPGALRFGPSSALASRVRSVARGPLPRDWVRTAIGAGQARREHDLRAPWPRAWRETEAALRESESGLDLLPESGGALPRGCTLAPTVPGLWALAVPDGGAIAWGGDLEPQVPSGPESEGGVGWRVWSTDAAGERSLEAWAAGGAVGNLRPSWFEARVADHHRFRAPFVDREPEYAELHGAYVAAMESWDLPERAAFALSDRGPRDLVALARELERSPAWLADVLLAMADDGIIAGELRPRGPGMDWQADVSEGWSQPDPPAGRSTDPRPATLLDASGCRAQALAQALRVSDPGACGRCDRCDSGMGWFDTVAKGSARPQHAMTQVPSSVAGLDLGALFKGLGDGAATSSSEAASEPSNPPDAKPAATRRPSAPPVPVLSAGASDEELNTALASFPASALWVAAAYQHRGPAAGRPLPAEARDALLAVLCGAAPSGATVRHGEGGRVQIHLPAGPARGSHQFRPREARAVLLSRLAPYDREGGPLWRLLERQQEHHEQGIWEVAVTATLTAALDSNPDLPSADLLGSVPRERGATVPPLWLDSDDEAVTALRNLGTPAVLAARGRERLAGEGALSAPADRLALRALGLLEAPTLEPREIRRWLSSPEPLPREILEACRAGSRRAWAELLIALPSSLRDPGLSAAVHARRLPEHAAELARGLAEGLDWEASVLLALPPSKAPWPAADRELAVQQALVEALAAQQEDSALVAGGRAFLRQVAADGAVRRDIVASFRAGRIAEAFAALAERGAPRSRHLAPSPPEAEAFAALRARAAHEQKAYTPALARALASGALVAGSVGEAGIQALEDAAAAGWAGGLVALLRGQARKHPADAARRAWLARAMAAMGRWSDAHASFREADRLLGGVAGLDLLWQGLEHTLLRSPEDALPWLEAAIRRGPPHEISRRLALLAWAGKFPPNVAVPLAERLRDEGSGVWAGAMRALEQSRR